MDVRIEAPFMSMLGCSTPQWLTDSITGSEVVGGFLARFFIYESTMHVPWVVKFPRNEFAGQRVDQPASLVDAYPTFLHGLGLSRRHWPPGLQGESRYRAARVGGPPSSAPLYMESMTPRNQFGWSDLRAIFNGRWKLIEAPTPELYDLQNDPRESRNLFADQGALGKRTASRSSLNPASTTRAAWASGVNTSP